jgi:hypothetical protein
MIFPATCKFCKKAVNLEIDDAYAAERDPLGLIVMACCNRCGDFRIKRRETVETMRSLCSSVITTKVGDGARLSQLREALVITTKAFARNLCGFLKTDSLIWSEDLADEMMKRPREIGKILGDFSRVVRKRVEQLPLAPAGQTPYRDD